MDISLDTTVPCLDGAGGRSSYILLNPSTKIVTHLVIVEKKAPHCERLVPIHWIKATTPELVLLDCTRDRLSSLDQFVVTEFLQLEVPDRYSVVYPYIVSGQINKPKKTISIEVENIPFEEVAVRHGARIEACNGPIGVLEAVQIDPADGRLTQLRLRIGPNWEPHVVTVQAAEIERIEERTIYLKLTKADIIDLTAEVM